MIGSARKSVSIVVLTLAGVSNARPGPIEDAAAANARGDYTTEVRILRPLAENGNAVAQNHLALKYAEGHGVIQDYTEAVRWYRLAAVQGHASAQFNLGYVYAKGQGVVQDFAEALKWHRLAAAQGHAMAQLSLGEMYGLGQGVVRDYVRSHMWLNLATANGIAEAAKLRDFVSGLMTLQQIAEAQRLARECQVRRFKGCE